MSERIKMQVKGGIGGLRMHEKVMPGCYAKVSDVLAATDEMLDRITLLAGNALGEAERRGRWEGIFIGMWIAFAIHALVRVIGWSIG